MNKQQIKDILEKNMHQSGFDIETAVEELYKSYGIVKRFETVGELSSHISLNMPFAIKATKPSKTKLVNPFTSNNARNIIESSIVESLI